MHLLWYIGKNVVQKQPSIIKWCSINIQQIYRRTPTPKCDFNKFAEHLYWNHTTAWVFYFKLAAYFFIFFSKHLFWGLLLIFSVNSFHVYLPLYFSAICFSIAFSYRSQSLEFQFKSIDWFLYDGIIGYRRAQHLEVQENINLKWFKMNNWLESLKLVMETFLLKTFHENFPRNVSLQHWCLIPCENQLLEAMILCKWFPKRLETNIKQLKIYPLKA